MDQLSKYINGWGRLKRCIFPLDEKIREGEKMMTFSLQNITHSYHIATPVLEDVSIHIQKGKVHALLGMNGAGKSTFTKNSNW